VASGHVDPTIPTTPTRGHHRRCYDDIINELSSCSSLIILPTSLFPLIASYAIPLHRIILIGGRDANQGRLVLTIGADDIIAPTNVPSSSPDKIHVLKSDAKQWTALPSLPYPSYLSSTQIIDDMIVVHGSAASTGFHMNHLNDVISLNISSLREMDTMSMTDVKWQIHCHCREPDGQGNTSEDDGVLLNTDYIDGPIATRAVSDRQCIIPITDYRRHTSSVTLTLKCDDKTSTRWYIFGKYGPV
jgi:hypothetical protein